MIGITILCTFVGFCCGVLAGIFIVSVAERNSHKRIEKEING